MVSALHPKSHSSFSPQIQKAAVNARAVAARQMKQFPIISSALPSSPSPMAMAARGAPPWAMSMVKAPMR